MAAMIFLLCDRQGAFIRKWAIVYPLQAVKNG